jgi:hypothetical protein
LTYNFKENDFILILHEMKYNEIYDDYLNGDLIDNLNKYKLTNSFLYEKTI